MSNLFVGINLYDQIRIEEEKEVEVPVVIDGEKAYTKAGKPMFRKVSLTGDILFDKFFINDDYSYSDEEETILDQGELGTLEDFLHKETDLAVIFEPYDDLVLVGLELGESELIGDLNGHAIEALASLNRSKFFSDNMKDFIIEVFSID